MMKRTGALAPVERPPQSRGRSPAIAASRPCAGRGLHCRRPPSFHHLESPLVAVAAGDGDAVTHSKRLGEWRRTFDFRPGQPIAFVAHRGALRRCLVPPNRTTVWAGKLVRPCRSHGSEDDRCAGVAPAAANRHAPSPRQEQSRGSSTYACRPSVSSRPSLHLHTHIDENGGSVEEGWGKTPLDRQPLLHTLRRGEA